jgi:two-component system, OmpR family, KDP operon response regulator KdpE
MTTEDKGLRILVIDDEPQIIKFLKVSLGSHGFDIDEAGTGADGISRAASGKPDLIIVDLGLPDMDGKAVVKAIREWSVTPIIVLSAREQEKEKVEAFDVGADDYVTKPFGIGELIARIRVAIRHSTPNENDPLLVCGNLTVDLELHRVMIGGREVKLTPTEFALIKLLAQHQGKVLTQKQILKSVWGNEYTEDTHYVRIYIAQLRRKIEPNPTQPQYIITESGIGYRLIFPTEAPSDI